MRLVGIGGLPRSGKDTLAELFLADGWFGMSFGDFTRMHARERHKDKPDPISVANMTETSNWLRETHGPDVILKEAVKQFEQRQKEGKYDKGLLLWSVRAPVEVDFILAHGGHLIWVETSDEIRWQRGLENLREGEPRLSLDEFKAHEALQWQPQPGIPKEVQMDIGYVKNHATKVLENNAGREEFIQKARTLIDSEDK